MSLRLWCGAVAACSLLACSAGVEGDDDEVIGSAQGELLVPGDVLKPLPITKPWPRPWPFPLDPEELVEITAGNSHSCVRKRNGNVYCWGRDDLGQAGQLPNAQCAHSPNHECVDRPERVYPFGGFGPATQIDAGDQHVCALDAAGKASCWGSASHGQLGVGVTGFIAEPVAVLGGLSFTSISAGTFSSCGTTADGMFCWGHPIAAGSAFVPNQLTPTRVYSATGLAPTGVSVGFAHVCAQWVSGTYRETNCWGRNWEGQTGSSPVAFTLLGQGPFGVTSDAPRVTTQLDFTCVEQAGPNVVCFGAGTNGQLGSGVTGNSWSPQQVGGFSLLGGPPPMALRGVSTGQFHACALDPNGAAYCWGNGNFGQLGNGLSPTGSGVSSALPAAVTGGLRFKAIAAGQRHTCAIGVDNHIYCWGSNFNGELGTRFKSTNQFTDGWVADPVRALDPVD